MHRVYITANHAEGSSGGDQVVQHEINALRGLDPHLKVIDRPLITPKQYEGLDVPFLQDYFALAYLKSIGFGGGPMHFHFYSGTFSHTIAWVKSHGATVTYTCPAHDRQATMDEFRLLGLPYPYPHIADDELWRVFIQGVKLADRVIVPSSHSAAFLTGQGVANITIIPHGFVPTKHSPLPYPEEFTVGYLGQVGPDKGLRYLIEAWAELDWDDATLVMAGPGTELLEHHIPKHVDSGRFQLLGWVPSPSDLYNMVSVYVQPSVTEAFGIEVLEAMAHCRPVIVSKGAGASDVVEDGVTGFVVNARDAKAITSRLRDVKAGFFKNPGMSKRMLNTANKYTWDKIEERYVELFSSL